MAPSTKKEKISELLEGYSVDDLLALKKRELEKKQAELSAQMERLESLTGQAKPKNKVVKKQGAKRGPKPKKARATRQFGLLDAMIDALTKNPKGLTNNELASITGFPVANIRSATSHLAGPNDGRFTASFAPGSERTKVYRININNNKAA